MKNKEVSPIKKAILVRVKILYVVFFLIGLCIFGRILWLQYGPEGAGLRAKAERTNFALVRVDAARGEIVTEGGELLATSVQKYYVGIDFKATGLTQEIFDAGVDGLSENMSRLMGDRSAEGYKTMIRGGWNNRNKVRYLRLTRRLVDYDELQLIKTFPLMNLPANRGGRVVDVVTDRVRPYGSLAERTIGRTKEIRDTVVKPGRDSTNRQATFVLTEKGETGIEYSFNDQLRGRSGWVLKQKITESFYIPVAESEMNVEPVNGRDVVTTLDMDFQDVAEDMLRAQLLKYDALWGTVVVMEVATGKIRAMSNLTNRSGRCVEDRNYALGGVAEPGSTFKLASLLALLDDGMSLDETIELGNGVYKKFSDDHTPEKPVETLRRVFEVSSNVGFVKAVEKRFKEKGREKDYVDYITGLGFDKPLGTRMVGEATPIFRKPTPEEKKDGRWHSNSILYMSHGYGFEISPLHTLTLYNAIANNGRMMRPMLIRELREFGQTVQLFQPEAINPSIAPPRTIKAVRESLEGVVDAGTAQVLKNPYYAVAAKTGTAQVLTGGSYRTSGGVRHYMATMVGYFPADNPKYSCIVVIQTRFGAGAWNPYHGASLAGPVFRAVADRIYATHYEWQTPIDKVLPRVHQPPEIKGGPAPDVRKVARELDIKLTGEAKRNSWVATKTDSTFVSAAPLVLSDGTVPPVMGMGLSDALYAIESRGLKVRFNGKGKVVSQSPKAGENIRHGATVTITLK